MYWGQVALALTAALAIGYGLSERGHGLTTAVLAAVVVYICVRWLIAWLYRIRYWYRRGTQGHYATSCPDCGQYIYRRRRDWILSCGRCGWTAGLPGVRWLTQSVPARQLRRTVVGPQLLVVVIAVAAIATGAVSGVALNNGSVPDVSGEPAPVGTGTETVVVAGQAEVPEGQTPTTSPTPAPTSTPTPTDTPESPAIATERAEAEILERVNNIRSERGLATLSNGSAASELAEKHSEDMATLSFYSHGGPNGEPASERMRRVGNRCGGAASENIHKGPRMDQVMIYGGGGYANLNTVLGISEYAVKGWMNSDGHRENMLDGRWSRAGVGVYATDEDVYMTIIFC